MRIIEWTDSLSVGHKAIDDQHEQWIAIYKTAHARMTSSSQGRLLTLGSDTLKEMIAFTQYHFAFEENLTEEIGYCETEHHEKLHRNFNHELDDLTLQIHQEFHILNS